MMRLSCLYVWRNVVELGYPVLESFLSTYQLGDECLICYDPDFPKDVELAQRLARKFPTVSLVSFRWPQNVPGDGSRIGIASQFALGQARGEYCLNVQADEIYPVDLKNWIQNNWKQMTRSGVECLDFKVLNTEHNMQQYQGGDEGSTWNWQCGAGYNRAVKLFKHCPAVKFAHDGWSIEGCATLYHVELSEVFPIVHAHDCFRDTLISLRQTAADEIWTDRAKFGHYHATAEGLAESRARWWDDPKWTRTTSRFEALLPDFAKSLLGRTRYEVRYELLEDFE